MASETDLYEVLGLVFSVNLSQSDIKRAYRKRAKECHPDKNQHDPLAAEKFQLVNKAYETLSNEKEKLDYDQKIRAKLLKKQQLEEMDVEMRKKRDDLETRENAAKRRRVDGFKSDVEMHALKKAKILHDNYERQRQMEERETTQFLEKIKRNQSTKQPVTISKGILSLQWRKKSVSELDISNITFYLNHFGKVENIIPGKRKVIVVMSFSLSHMIDALINDKNSVYTLSWIEKPLIITPTSPPTSPSTSTPQIPTQEEHDLFEEEILKQMGQVTG
jgi:DnaJ homolog subfamily C member 17